jgi:hypothetical protein
MEECFTPEHLSWRPFAASDLNMLYYLYSQPELMRSIIGRTRSYEETEDNLKAHMTLRERYGFGPGMVSWKTTGEIIGRGGLMPVVYEEVLQMFAQLHERH